MPKFKSYSTSFSLKFCVGLDSLNVEPLLKLHTLISSDELFLNDLLLCRLSKTVMGYKRSVLQKHFTVHISSFFSLPFPFLSHCRLTVLTQPEVEVVLQVPGALLDGVQDEVGVSAVKSPVQFLWDGHQVEVLHPPYLEAWILSCPLKLWVESCHPACWKNQTLILDAFLLHKQVVLTADSENFRIPFPKWDWNCVFLINDNSENKSHSS